MIVFGKGLLLGASNVHRNENAHISARFRGDKQKPYPERPADDRLVTQPDGRLLARRAVFLGASNVSRYENVHVSGRFRDDNQKRHPERGPATTTEPATTRGLARTSRAAPFFRPFDAQIVGVALVPGSADPAATPLASASSALVVARL